jgi:hypothetical protein
MKIIKNILITLGIINIIALISYFGYCSYLEDNTISKLLIFMQTEDIDIKTQAQDIKAWQKVITELDIQDLIIYNESMDYLIESTKILPHYEIDFLMQNINNEKYLSNKMTKKKIELIQKSQNAIAKISTNGQAILKTVNTCNCPTE